MFQSIPSTIMKFTFILGFASPEVRREAGTTFAPASVLWNSRAAPAVADPCCSVVSIDRLKGIVTVRNLRTRAETQIQVSDLLLLRALAIGAKVWMDSRTSQYGFKDGVWCCRALAAPTPRTIPTESEGGSTPPTTTVPSKMTKLVGRHLKYNIITIDVRSGVVTALDPATNRSIQFKAASTLVARLAIGQSVWANLDTKEVSLRVDGADPCCEIVSPVVRP